MNEVLKNNTRNLQIGFGAKSLDYLDVTVNGIEREFFEVQNKEYYFPSFTWDGLPVTERAYSSDELLDLLHDLEDSSFVRETYDKNKLQSESTSTIED